MRSYRLVLALFAVGCGGEAIIDPPLGSGGATGSTSSSSTTTNTSSTSTSTSSGQPADFSIEIVNASGGANCQPAVPPDPMDLLISLEVDNSMNTQALQVAVNEVSIEGEGITSTFEVDLVQSGLVSAGTVGQIDLVKVPGTLSGTPGSGCAWCELGTLQNSTLVLDVVAEGVPFTVEGRVDSYSCVF